MALNLFLLRHGKTVRASEVANSEDMGGVLSGDAARYLLPRGEEAAAGQGEFLTQAGVQLDYILCSPVIRTRQTLAALSKTFDTSACAITYPPELYTHSAPEIFSMLRNDPHPGANRLVIGHEPWISSLAQGLCHPPDKSEDKDRLADYHSLHSGYPTGSLTWIEFSTINWGDLMPESGKLMRFLKPVRSA